SLRPSSPSGSELRCPAVLLTGTPTSQSYTLSLHDALPIYITAESEQESEHVAAGLDGIGADIPLRGQIVCQKVRHVDGEIGRFHGSTLRGMTSPKAASDRAVISGKSSAVRCR